MCKDMENSNEELTFRDSTKASMLIFCYCLGIAKVQALCMQARLSHAEPRPVIMTAVGAVSG